MSAFNLRKKQDSVIAVFKDVTPNLESMMFLSPAVLTQFDHGIIVTPKVLHVCVMHLYMYAVQVPT